MLHDDRRLEAHAPAPPTGAGRAALTAARAMRAGVRRVTRAPFLLLALLLVNAVVALPATWVIRRSLERSIGPSLVEEKLRDGFDMPWYGEYRQQARGLESSFGPEVTGAGAFLGNVEGWLTGGLFRGEPALVATGVGYALIWTLLLGGIIDRFAGRQRSRGGRRLLEAGGRYFFRFVRLVLLSAIPYFLIYRLHGWMFDRLGVGLRDVTSERTMMAYALAAYTVTALLLTLVHVCFGYAKVATVVDDRRSMLLAALRGVGIVVRHPGRTLGLYYGLLTVSAVLLAFYAAFAPGAGQSTTAGVVYAFLAGQAFLLVRLAVRLTLWGGQTALYRSLTGAGDAQRAVPVPAVRA